MQPVPCKFNAQRSDAGGPGPRRLCEADYADTVFVPGAGVIDDGITQEAWARLDAEVRRDHRLSHLLIPESCLRRRLVRLAADIADGTPAGRRLDLVVVLTGAFMFAADLGRELAAHGERDLYFHLVRATAYGDDIKRAPHESRTARLERLPPGLQDRHVVIVEDIVDQGITVGALSAHIRAHCRVASLRICSLFVKRVPEREGAPPRPAVDHAGFSVPDVWIAGYGTDAGQDFRYLPYLVAVNEAHYRPVPGAAAGS
jgi:hypoxanthine phosphoribosyltransferase